MAGETRESLIRMLVERSYRRGAPGSFRLASGKLSDTYIDCRVTTLHSAAMPLIGQLFAEHVPADAAGIGGMTMGADPIALATAYFLETRGRHIEAFSIRKEPKKHGLSKWLEGQLGAGSRVVVVDDVATTGGSTIEAVRRCRDAELIIAGVILLVDRQEGGVEAIRGEVGSAIPVQPIFTRADLEECSSAPAGAGTASAPIAPR